MKSMRPPSVTIFFMTYFHRAGGGAMAPSAPPGSATVTFQNSSFLSFWYLIKLSISKDIKRWLILSRDHITRKSWKKVIVGTGKNTNFSRVSNFIFWIELSSSDGDKTAITKVTPCCVFSVFFIRWGKEVLVPSTDIRENTRGSCGFIECRDV